MTKILIVEDNEMNRDALSRLLKRKGFQVVMAVDGAEGLAMARTEQPNIILMDMSLPVIDGFEATRQLKAANDTRTIPVIGLSAHAMTGDADRALQAGCDDYDTKPVELPRLLVKIQAQLNRMN
jgi:CheY-like chemotaxis protein